MQVIGWISLKIAKIIFTKSEKSSDGKLWCLCYNFYERWKEILSIVSDLILCLMVGTAKASATLRLAPPTCGICVCQVKATGKTGVFVE